MSSKKIIFIIVEGPSDEEALGVPLTRFFNNSSVYVYVMHCDITTKSGIVPGNIVSHIGNVLRQFAGRYFKPEDFTQIIHITDMDSAFIPGDNIIEDPKREGILYHETSIYTHNKAQIDARNPRKRQNINKLLSTSTVWRVPYHLHYMSFNLDHILHEKLNSSDGDKERNAL